MPGKALFRDHLRDFVQSEKCGDRENAGTDGKCGDRKCGDRMRGHRMRGQECGQRMRGQTEHPHSAECIGPHHILLTPPPATTRPAPATSKLPPAARETPLQLRALIAALLPLQPLNSCQAVSRSPSARREPARHAQRSPSPWRRSQTHVLLRSPIQLRPRLNPAAPREHVAIRDRCRSAAPPAAVKDSHRTAASRDQNL
jgi:hypothetical protein